MFKWLVNNHELKARPINNFLFPKLLHPLPALARIPKKRSSEDKDPWRCGSLPSAPAGSVAI